jgi:rod shape-determining protein MreD
VSRIAAATLILFAALAQVTWAHNLSVLGVLPNLVLVATVAIAWTHGQRAGLGAACVGGLLLDLEAPGPLGPHALALLCAAYVAGLWARDVDPSRWMQPAFATAVVTVIYSLVLIGADDTLDLAVPPLNLAAQLAGMAALYNAVLAVPAVIALRRTRAELPA